MAQFICKPSTYLWKDFPKHFMGLWSETGRRRRAVQIFSEFHWDWLYFLRFFSSEQNFSTKEKSFRMCGNSMYSIYPEVVQSSNICWYQLIPEFCLLIRFYHTFINHIDVFIAGWLLFSFLFELTPSTKRKGRSNQVSKTFTNISAMWLAWNLSPQIILNWL